METTNIDKVLMEQEKKKKSQAEMKKSLIQKKNAKEAETLFEHEIKKMPEDTHNKVLLGLSSSISRGNSICLAWNLSGMGHTT